MYIYIQATCTCIMIQTAKFIYPFIESLTDAIIKEGKNPTSTKFKEKKQAF